MTTPHKALLIQALKALKNSIAIRNHEGGTTYGPSLEIPAIAALTAAIDAPEPKPVAWRFDRPGISKLDAWPHGGEWEPLYLHPAPREPLSDAEIDAAWRSVDYQASYDQFRRDVGRAIEAAHGIKS